MARSSPGMLCGRAWRVVRASVACISLGVQCGRAWRAAHRASGLRVRTSLSALFSIRCSCVFLVRTSALHHGWPMTYFLQVVYLVVCLLSSFSYCMFQFDHVNVRSSLVVWVQLATVVDFSELYLPWSGFLHPHYGCMRNAVKQPTPLAIVRDGEWG